MRPTCGCPQVISPETAEQLNITLSSTDAGTSRRRLLAEPQHRELSSSSYTATVTIPSTLSTYLSLLGYGSNCTSSGLSVQTLLWLQNKYQVYTNGLGYGMSINSTVVSLAVSDCSSTSVDSPIYLNSSSDLAIDFGLPAIVLGGIDGVSHEISCAAGSRESVQVGQACPGGSGYPVYLHGLASPMASVWRLLTHVLLAGRAQVSCPTLSGYNISSALLAASSSSSVLSVAGATDSGLVTLTCR